MDCEFAAQPIRDIRALNRSLLVSVRTGLLADEAQLAHQPTHTETANRHAILAQHAHDASATSRAPTLAKQLVDATAQRNATSINTATSKAMGVIARPCHIER